MKPLRNDLKKYCNWRRKFALLPHRCDITNRIIWLEYAHCERPYWTTITNTVKLKTIWHDEFEHLNWAIINGL
jgi:hypothetical protein